MIKKIIDLSKTKKGKMVFFFGFYAVFFIIVFVYLSGIDTSRLVKNSNTNNEKIKEESSDRFNSSKLQNSDYQYKVSITENEDIEILEGSKDNSSSISNYKYAQLINLEDINRIIKNAKYLSTTSYNDDTYRIDYEIKTNELSDIYEVDKVDIDEINIISLYTNRNKELLKIEYDFSNYIKLLDENMNIYKVLIEYVY